MEDDCFEYEAEEWGVAVATTIDDNDVIEQSGE